MTDNVGQLLMERSLPRRKDVTIRLANETRRVPMGSRLRSELPAEVDGHPVVAGLIDQKPVSLSLPLSSDATVAPLTTGHWEGERIYRRSVGLLLLEAASRMSPALRLRLGPSLGAIQEVHVAGTDRDRAAVAADLSAAMRNLVAEDLPFRQEWWTVEEAASQFAEWGWQSAARLLKVWRDAMVMLVSCGKVYAISMGPLAPCTGLLGGFRLEPRGNALVLTFDRGERLLKTALDLPDLQDRDGSTMLIEHRRWLDNLGVTDVGAFNEHCVSGQVSQLIRVAEGFHEKRIGQIADAIVSRASGVRVIGIAGPSSSGKTTFIKRLTVQLQINGINPVGISLDDYYVDRDKTPLDAAGEYDYEAFEALDIALLQDQLRRLMRGEAVKMARYDFISGKSQPEGGPELRLHPHDVLMLEGIHGLNPGLIGDLLGHEAVFRVFVNPMTALPFDHLDHFSVSDLRLLRRIVRDRFTRGCSAADNILRWPSVRAGERNHIFPFLSQADAVFDTALIYEPAVLKVFADRYLLEVPQDHPAYLTAYRLRQLIDRFVTIYPEHVPSTSILREFIGGSGFE
jgi:uridine kinase